MTRLFHARDLIRNARLGITTSRACPSCGDNDLTPDDMATEFDYYAATLAALRERYGAPVCRGCADRHRLCETCERAVDEDEGRTDYHSGAVYCDDCYRPTAYDLACDREDDRAKVEMEYGH